MITVEVMCPICEETMEIQFPDNWHEDDAFEEAIREEPWPVYCKACEDRYGLTSPDPYDSYSLSAGPYTRYAFTSA